MSKKHIAIIRQGIRSKLSGEIEGLIVTIDGVMYLKPIKQINKRKKQQ